MCASGVRGGRIRTTTLTPSGTIFLFPFCFVLGVADRVQERSQYLLDIYQDDDGARRAEINALSGATEFSEFYQRLKNIKDYHRRYPNEQVELMELEFQHRDKEKEEEDLENMFSGEEGFGKYVDMHSLFEKYVNLKGAKQINYLTYLGEFENCNEFPSETKESSEYASYVDEMKVYLEGFFKRSQPLFNLQELRERIRPDFELKWEEEGQQKMEEEAELKELYCLACEKQFAKKTVFDGHLNGKKHKKAAAALLEKGVTSISAESRDEARVAKARERRDRAKPLAWAEVLVIEYAKLLSMQREDTRANIERKQALTDRELISAQEEEAVELSESEDEEEEKIYNPLKLPLGWDGKPIPYWLYKLHGLGVEHPCEICGNFVYMGRKAFDRHFQAREWRHAHGMRCLGIPNTRHFHEITLIEDAYA
ncbi:hypothetical protein BDK51DRAFT_17016, partial [Blyttiomyces helicus]